MGPAFPSEPGVVVGAGPLARFINKDIDTGPGLREDLSGGDAKNRRARGYRVTARERAILRSRPVLAKPARSFHRGRKSLLNSDEFLQILILFFHFY